MAPAYPTLIIEVSVPSNSALLFQSLLEAEDGLGVLRCFDASGRRHQIWSAPAQSRDLHAWLDGLPESLQVRRLDRWMWGTRRSDHS